jgi:hypothetical protein
VVAAATAGGDDAASGGTKNRTGVHVGAVSCTASGGVACTRTQCRQPGTCSRSRAGRACGLQHACASSALAGRSAGAAVDGIGLAQTHVACVASNVASTVTITAFDREARTVREANAIRAGRRGNIACAEN